MKIRLLFACCLIGSKSLAQDPVTFQDPNGLYGYKNAKGKRVAPAKYVEAGIFREGMAFVAEKGTGFGYINARCELVIPYKYSSASGFSEGLAAVRDQRSQWGFIDKTGKLVIPFQFEATNGFSEG